MFIAIVIGALIGYQIARVPGLLIGAALAYWIVRRLRTRLQGGIAQIQSQFLESTFAVMGALCKADGQVTRDEIKVAEALFNRLRLAPEQREVAKAAFNRGKANDFDLDAELASVRRTARGQRALLQMFLQVQLSAITADGELHQAEHDMLLRVARGLGFSEAEVRQLEAMLRGASGASARGASSPQQLDDAYRVLGVDPSASDMEIKKAYRRLMSQNHPDKLASKGLPESMREMAEQKTSEISHAYDLVKQARGQA